MTARDDFTDPLPSEWLPPSTVPPEDDVAYWERRFRTLMADAEPTLAGYRRPHPTVASWLQLLALRWRPALAGAVAVAASAVLALAAWGGRPGAPDARSALLSTIVSGGAPAALWQGVGQDADPVLALIALETGTDLEGGVR